MPGNIITLDPAAIANWPTPNYVDPVSRDWLPAFSGTLYGVATVMVTLRLWLRATKQAGALGWDDALLMFAWLSSTVFTVVEILGAAKYDIGRHAWDVPTANFENIALTTWLAELTFLITGGATKISVLLFYRRLAEGSYDRRWKWAVVSALIFTATWTLAFILTLVFNCSPTEAYWKAYDPTYPGTYTCVNTTVVNLLAGVFANVSDLYAMALPLLMTRHLCRGLPFVQKIVLNLIFCLWLLVVAASAARTYYLYEVGQQADVSWLIFDVFVWAQLEVQLAIMLAALPALRIFWRNYVGGRFYETTQDGFESRQTQLSDHPSRVIRRISGPDDHYQRDDFGAKHNSKSSLAETSISNFDATEGHWSGAKHEPNVSVAETTWTQEGIEMGTSASSMASTSWLAKSSAEQVVRTPEDYEAYNLQRLQVQRESLEQNHHRWSRRGNRGLSFSQPFKQTRSPMAAPMPTGYSSNATAPLTPPDARARTPQQQQGRAHSPVSPI